MINQVSIRMRGCLGRVPRSWAWATLVAVVAGCGLGYIDIEPEYAVQVVIENATTSTAEVTITSSAEESNESRGAEDDVIKYDEGDSAAQIIRVPGGQTATGSITCHDMLTLAASVAGSTETTNVQISGDGTGSLGFDSGTVGATGQRLLLRDTHYLCEDTVVLQVMTAETGVVTVAATPDELPDPVTSPTSDGDDEADESPGVAVPNTKISFRLENATATDAEFSISPVEGDSGEEGDDATGGEGTSESIRVPAGAYSGGEVACGSTYVVSASMGDDQTNVAVLTGDGTGTLGFDSSSIGLDGERLLAFSDHYNCGDTIVVRITDDGSGIGLSTAETAQGAITVYDAGQDIPNPELPDLDEEVDEQEGGTNAAESVELTIVNDTESTVQINFATGNGSLAESVGVDVTSEFDVRVPPATTSAGIGLCAQEYIIAAAHLESTGTTYAGGGGDEALFEGGGNVNYHGIVLSGDGTGTEGFDSSSIAVTRGRLFVLDMHFVCGDSITVRITATNNQLETDENGDVVLDEFGDPTVRYGIGNGVVTVSTED